MILGAFFNDIHAAAHVEALEFLASGKHFLVNNGPYLQNYDLPLDPNKQNWNLFVNQGQGRTWIARSPLTYDRWIPSVLFLTHYFPDDPRQWQQVNVASLILGQNGIWGDLSSISQPGIEYLTNILAKYKHVRRDITGRDITESDPVITGLVAGSPEIHEKISSSTGKGTIVVFATASGEFTYISAHRTVSEHWASEGVSLSRDSTGRAHVKVRFDQPGAKILLFGTR